jgi:hypothetical protein
VTEAEYLAGLASEHLLPPEQRWIWRRPALEVLGELDDAIGLRTYRKRFRAKIRPWVPYTVEQMKWWNRWKDPMSVPKTDPKRKMPHGETVIEAMSRLRAQKDGRTVEHAARREVTGMAPSGGRATAENYIYGVLFGPQAFRWPRKEKPVKRPSIRELIREAQKAAQLSDTA